MFNKNYKNGEAKGWLKEKEITLNVCIFRDK